ncbi:MAG: hypothetical protein P1U56_06315 [Saprospiraceae bacterium]|nr:hypothetical protein [Saprospiraceae bacterium]
MRFLVSWMRERSRDFESRPPAIPLGGEIPPYANLDDVNALNSLITKYVGPDLIVHISWILDNFGDFDKIKSFLDQSLIKRKKQECVLKLYMAILF